jgi:hypothetical protein
MSSSNYSSGASKHNRKRRWEATAFIIYYFYVIFSKFRAPLYISHRGLKFLETALVPGSQWHQVHDHFLCIFQQLCIV